VHDRHHLSDVQWAVLEPLLPSREPRRGRPWRAHREVVDAVLWRTRTGSPWRDLPASYGPWKTVYNRHRRWSADGTWVRVLAELQRGCDLDETEWVVAVDSTVIRAHHDAAGARHLPPTDVAAEVLATVLDTPAASCSDVASTGGDPTGGEIE